jgi:hypothetical protein
MRTIAPAAAAALAGQAVPLIGLLDLLFDIPVRLSTTPFDVVYGGNTYKGVGNLGSIDQVDDSPGEYKAMKFTLSGVNNDTLAIALNQEIHNVAAQFRLGVMDPVTTAILDAPLVWTGTLDQMPIEFGAQTSSIAVTAEHRGATFARPKPLRYADLDQQRLFPGDTSMRFVVSQSQHKLVWPAASYFADK